MTNEKLIEFLQKYEYYLVRSGKSLDYIIERLTKEHIDKLMGLYMDVVYKQMKDSVTAKIVKEIEEMVISILFDINALNKYDFERAIYRLASERNLEIGNRYVLMLKSNVHYPQNVLLSYMDIVSTVKSPTRASILIELFEMENFILLGNLVRNEIINRVINSSSDDDAIKEIDAAGFPVLRLQYEQATRGTNQTILGELNYAKIDRITGIASERPYSQATLSTLMDGHIKSMDGEQKSRQKIRAAKEDKPQNGDKN